MFYKINEIVKNIRKKEENMKMPLKLFIIIVLSIFNWIIISSIFNFDIFYYSKNLHKFLESSLGWIISVTCGELIFTTLLLGNFTEHYKNVKISKFFLEYRRKFNRKIYELELSSTLMEEIQLIFILLIISIIFFYYKIDIIILFALFYELILVFDNLSSSIGNMTFDSNDIFWKASIEDFISEKTFDDISTTKAKNIGDKNDIDTSLLNTVSNYIKENEYKEISDFKDDIVFLENNIKYSVENNKINSFCCAYSIILYLNIIDSKLEFLTKNNENIPQTINLLKLISGRICLYKKLEEEVSHDVYSIYKKVISSNIIVQYLAVINPS